MLQNGSAAIRTDCIAADNVVQQFQRRERGH
jgi:hypothetical protein